MFERCLYFNTNSLSRSLNAQWELAFAEFGLSAPHAYLLRLILATPGLNQQSIALELKLEKSTVARFLSALEDKSLIKRTPSNSDQRGKTIYPTAKAKRMQSDLDTCGQALYEHMCKSIGKRRVDSFVKTAREINELL